MSRPGRKCALTAQVEATICSYIRAGAFAWVAAQAAGIGRSTFTAWMADERPRFRAFQAKVEEAKAQARLAAETEVRKTDALAWLRLGPGRDKAGEPGWTESAKVEHSGPNGSPLPAINFTISGVIKENT